MKVRVSGEAVVEYAGDALVVGVTAERPLDGAAKEADAALGGAIAEAVSCGEIRGKANEITVLHTRGRMPSARLVVIGLGEAEECDLFVIRDAMAAAARFVRNRGCRRLATTLHTLLASPAQRRLAVRATVEGAYVGLYPGAECKTKQELPAELDELCLIGIPGDLLGAAEVDSQAGKIAGEAGNYARRLVNLPGGHVTPANLGQEAVSIGQETGAEVTVLKPAEIGELRMGAFLAVAQGSKEPARLIVIRHRGANAGPRVAFVGKGLTFDSGGISLKPANDMHLMKSDMAGAAAVLAAISALAKMKIGLDVIGIIPATENLPGGGAYRPGDVLTALNGKTIEVISTDAEGRLLLADALAYACQLGATHIVDVATLTGACIIALGHNVTGVMGNDNELMAALIEAGERAGERLWRLPLFREYRRQLDSAIADIKNVGGRPAGAITAAWFLQEFVGATSWAHMDIAGTAWNEKDRPSQVEGATGAGTRTLIALAERLAGGAA